MNILSIVHFITLFFPCLFYFIKNQTFKLFVIKNIRWIFLIYLFIPLHWKFFDNKCLLTYINEKLGKYKNARTNSAFSETYMGWLYRPIMKLFGWEWNDEGLGKMATLHGIINILLIWNITFYY